MCLCGRRKNRKPKSNSANTNVVPDKSDNPQLPQQNDRSLYSFQGGAPIETPNEQAQNSKFSKLVGKEYATMNFDEMQTAKRIQKEAGDRDKEKRESIKQAKPFAERKSQFEDTGDYENCEALTSAKLREIALATPEGL